MSKGQKMTPIFWGDDIFKDADGSSVSPVTFQQDQEGKKFWRRDIWQNGIQQNGTKHGDTQFKSR